ncbi:DMT family transporter [Gudongella oleilytica]|jgi:drug/metabolite transporter (DMT)-like permease|uniref:DMT family transporter n=1 Tax=Gudongella oleilytica TaxID=1582259 RepID=UPI002A35EB4C|nr:DMT family transporter [Gudongella oleilytica]MDY0257494.1 DMT family transporter [Gudongella oleilytica]
MDRKKITAVVFLIGSTIMFGLSFVSIKISMEVFPPLSMAFYRFLIACLILYPMLRKMSPGETLRKEHLPLMAFSGILGITIYFFFENNGVLRISPNDASIIIAIMPVAAAMGEWAFLRKKLSPISLAAIIASILGIYIIIGGKLEGGSVSGYLYMVGAIVSFSIFMIITKPLFRSYSGIAVTFYQSIFGTLAFIPFLWLETVRWSQLNGNIIFHFLFLAIGCSAIANFMYIYALSNLSVATTAIFMNLIPVFTFIFSYFIFGETLSPLQLFGAAVVIASVTVVTLQDSLTKQDV